MFSSLKNGNSPPDAGAVMARAIILKHLFVKALATPPAEYLASCRQKWTAEEWKQFIDGERTQQLQTIERLRQNGLWNEMEEEERNFMEATSAEVTQQKQIEASWRAESSVCLLWALGYVADLPPYDQQADPELTNQMPRESATVLIRKALLRPYEMIEKQRGLAELWHWRSRTRQLQESQQRFSLPNGMTIEKVIERASARAAADGLIPTPIGNDFPAFGKAYRDLSLQEYLQATSVAVERHRALNWLCGYAPRNRWVETPTDT